MSRESSRSTPSPQTAAGNCLGNDDTYCLEGVRLGLLLNETLWMVVNHYRGLHSVQYQVAAAVIPVRNHASRSIYGCFVQRAFNLQAFVAPCYHRVPSQGGG
jgi:hypothetical protein